MRRKAGKKKMSVFCNPLNINYRYQFIKDPQSGTVSVNREAADPSLICYRGRYYIFASMTLGVWVSDDLAHWENHRLPDDLPLYDYAPDVRVIGEWVVICASSRDQICHYYRTKDILEGPYEKVEGSFPFWDPNLFQDDDGRVYFYWGCSDEEPIYGIEVDPETLQPLCSPRELIFQDPAAIGYERVGEDHCLSRRPYIEGAWMNKHQGRYYLQYANPGTEFNIYGDGVYVGSSPLGPFHLAENNPYSYHPGGFMPGAGHGSTEADAEGKLWHAASMRISVNHMFERRVGLWRAGFDADGELFCNQRYGDWPMRTETADPWAKPEWFLQSYRKAAAASSHTPGHEPQLAADENAQTWWQAADGGPDEWLSLDLGKCCDVHAVQINFADERIDRPAPGSFRNGERCIDDAPMYTRWLLEGSEDGAHYAVLADKREAMTDLSHDLVVWEEGIPLRYLRLSHMEVPYGQRPCISGLRVFGRGDGPAPAEAVFDAERISDLDFTVRMHAEGAVGYNVLWGENEHKLYHSAMCFAKTLQIGALVKGRHYTVRVDAFNENGITEGTSSVRI